MKTGLEHHRAGRLLEAEHFYRKALAENNRNVAAVHLLGLVAFQADKLDLAEQYVHAATRLLPYHEPYLMDLAEIYQARGKTVEAMTAYRMVLKAKPEAVEPWHRLGLLHRERGEFDNAATCLREAVRLKPDHADAIRALGATQQTRGQMAEAQTLLEQAVQLAPQKGLNYFHLGAAFHEQGRLLEAIACYQKSLQLDPKLEGPRALCAEARLGHGEFVEGWAEFESWQREKYFGQKSNLPNWNGSDLGGRRIWVHGQYALGDVIQFVRYLPLVTSRGGEVWIDVPEKMIELLANSGVENLVPAGTTPADCAVQVHLLSLPKLFGTTVETVPCPAPYLKASADRVAQWKSRLPKGQKKIGIHWQGNPEYPLDRCRSFALAQFAPLAAVEGVCLVSLQKGPAVEQIEQLDGAFEVWQPEQFDGGSSAFLDTAAIMKNLDLVITCDTAIAHLAGALGVPVWVALATACDWRWLETRTDSPWYPSMRLFRQDEPGGWEIVFQRMATELAAR